MKKRRRIKWDVIIDLMILAVFCILTIYLLGAMVIRGLNLVELVLLLSSPILANRSLCNAIEE